MWTDRLEWNIEAKSDAAGSGHALPEHNALWASISPLCYASLCLNSTPTQKHAAFHTELVLTFSLVYLLFVLIKIISPIQIVLICSEGWGKKFWILRLWKVKYMHLTDFNKTSMDFKCGQWIQGLHVYRTVLRKSGSLCGEVKKCQTTGCTFVSV